MATVPRLQVLFSTFHYPPGFVGGAERQAQLQAEELVRRGHHVTVMATSDNRDQHSGVVNGVRVHRVPYRKHGPGWQPYVTARLAAYLLPRAHWFDVLHVHLAGPHLDALTAVAMLRGLPVYVKLAAGGAGGDIAKYPRWPLIPRAWGLRHVDRLQVISAEIAGEVRALGVPESRVVEIPNGLDLKRFRPVSPEERREARVRLGLATEEPIVLYVGRLHPEKGTPELISLWEDASKRPSARLVTVGQSKWRYSHEEFSKIPGVTARPFASDILDYYRAADIFVLPSHIEGMSNALLEAMASGLPAIATRVGAADTMIDDGESGLLVQPGDVPALARALDRLLLGPAYRERLGAAASTAVQRYSIERVVDQIEREYLRLVEERRR